MSESARRRSSTPRVLYDLRRRVLRGNNPESAVDFVDDDAPSARHFAGLLDDRVVASASFFSGVAPIRPELVSYQLRFMAVDFDVQGRGFGAVVLDAAEDQLRELGARATVGEREGRGARLLRRDRVAADRGEREREPPVQPAAHPDRQAAHQRREMNETGASHLLGLTNAQVRDSARGRRHRGWGRSRVPAPAQVTEVGVGGADDHVDAPRRRLRRATRRLR